MSSTNGVEQSDRADAIAAAMLTCPLQRDVAARLGISTDTLRRELRKPEVQAACSEARRELLAGTIGALQSSMLEAIQVLQRLMRDSESEWMRHQCATTLLTQGLRAVEIFDTEQRLARIESMLEQYYADEN
jgi:hypothetical protein